MASASCEDLLALEEDCFMYFAYGSNLLAERLHLRNPSAAFCCAARLQVSARPPVLDPPTESCPPATGPPPRLSSSLPTSCSCRRAGRPPAPDLGAPSPHPFRGRLRAAGSGPGPGSGWPSVL